MNRRSEPRSPQQTSNAASVRFTTKRSIHEVRSRGRKSACTHGAALGRHRSCAAASPSRASAATDLHPPRPGPSLTRHATPGASAPPDVPISPAGHRRRRRPRRIPRLNRHVPRSVIWSHAQVPALHAHHRPRSRRAERRPPWRSPIHWRGIDAHGRPSILHTCLIARHRCAFLSTLDPSRPRTPSPRSRHHRFLQKLRNFRRRAYLARDH